MKLLTGRVKPLIGMVHVHALPGTPRHRLPMRDICARAAEEARQLREGGFDAVLIENMHDVPYLKRGVGPEIVAAMTAAALTVGQAVDCPVGIQILAGANREALAAAHAAGAQFVRVEGFVFAHIADEGLIEADAGSLLRYRKSIGADPVEILADVQKKHSSHAITSDLPIADEAEAAEFFGADALIITGTVTARPVKIEDLVAARASKLPVFIGSGVTPDNFRELAPHADGFIIGSCLKEGGRWDAPLDLKRVRKMADVARVFREANLLVNPSNRSEIY